MQHWEVIFFHTCSQTLSDPVETVIPIEIICKGIECCPFCSEQIASWTSQALFFTMHSVFWRTSFLLSNAAIPPAIPFYFLLYLLFRRPPVTVMRMGSILTCIPSIIYDLTNGVEIILRNNRQAFSSNTGRTVTFTVHVHRVMTNYCNTYLFRCFMLRLDMWLQDLVITFGKTF